MNTEFLHKTYFGNDLLSYFIALGVLVVGLVVVRVFQYIVLKAVARWTAKTSTQLDDFFIQAFRRAVIPLMYYAALYFSLRSLHLNPALDKALTAFGTALLTFTVIRLILQVFQYFLFNVWLAKRGDDRVTLERQFKAVMPIAAVLVWGLGIVFLLDNLGFKISTLVAGLGIGGVAVALASQTVLGDMFSYFAIMMDRPFELDDFVVTGDFMGSVEHIGIKTTRLRSLSGEQLVFSNKDLTDSRIRNYKRMELRRIEFNIGVAYDTPADKLKKAPEMIKAIISKIPNTRFDRSHFFAFEDAKLTVQTVYFVLSADYNVYMDIQQQINFEIMQAFEKEGIDFAFKPQQVYLKPDGTPEDKPVRTSEPRLTPSLR